MMTASIEDVATIIAKVAGKPIETASRAIDRHGLRAHFQSIMDQPLEN